MITLVRCPAEAKKTAIAAENLKQGSWVYMSGSDGTPTGVSTDFEMPLVSLVNSATIAKYDKGKLFPVMKYPADEEGAESAYETIPAGEQVLILDGSGIEIEDDTSANFVPHDNWSSLARGTALSLTVSGQITFVNGPGYDSNHTTIGYFDGYANGIITYRTA